jgi:2-oxo-4-hydroxy-4-carboxy-5-ureidoimidazoline decarboxylase
MNDLIAQLNTMDQETFVATLGFVFEGTPTIAAQTWQARPFSDLTDLHAKMLTVVNAMTDAEKLALIKAHPDLGSKAKMAEASVQEQSGAGLDQLTPEEFTKFESLNQAYKDRFGFPFIIAVKNHTKTSILQAFEVRLQNSQTSEMQQAIAEISAIARFRLIGLLQTGI